MPDQCLRLHGLDRAGLVLDPFLGLGNTAIAATRLGLDFVGVEMDEHYLKEAAARGGIRGVVGDRAAQLSQSLLLSRDEGFRSLLLGLGGTAHGYHALFLFFWGKKRVQV